MEILGTGQYPKSRPWKTNVEGARTVEESLEIARNRGLIRPDDIAVVIDSWGLITEPETDARYFRWSGLPTAVIRWSQFYALNGKIPIIVKSEVFQSDEAIIAVLGHELFEIEALRRLFAAAGGTMNAQRLRELVHANIPGNLHDQAWAYADKLVEEMRVTT